MPAATGGADLGARTSSRTCRTGRCGATSTSSAWWRASTRRLGITGPMRCPAAASRSGCRRGWAPPTPSPSRSPTCRTPTCSSRPPSSTGCSRTTPICAWPSSTPAPAGCRSPWKRRDLPVALAPVGGTRAASSRRRSGSGTPVVSLRRLGEAGGSDARHAGDQSRLGIPVSAPRHLHASGSPQHAVDHGVEETIDRLLGGNAATCSASPASRAERTSGPDHRRPLSGQRQQSGQPVNWSTGSGRAVTPSHARATGPRRWARL